VRFPAWSPCVENPETFDCGGCEIGFELNCRLREDASQRRFRAAEWRRRTGLQPSTTTWGVAAIRLAVELARAQGLPITARMVRDRPEMAATRDEDSLERTLRASGAFEESSPSLFTLMPDPQPRIAPIAPGSGSALETLANESPPRSSGEQLRLAVVLMGANAIAALPSTSTSEHLEELIESSLAKNRSLAGIGLAQLQRWSDGSDRVPVEIGDDVSPVLTAIFALDLLARNGYEGSRSLGAQAKEMLVVGNIRLVVAQARALVWKSNLEFVDVVQEGVIGLMRAIDGYDPYRGFAVTTYAVPWIRQAIQRAIHDQGRTIRLPVHVGALMDRLRWIAAEAELDFDQTPAGLIHDALVLAGETGLTVERIATLQAAALDPIPLSQVALDTILNSDATSAPAVEAPRAQAVKIALSELTTVEKKVVDRRYGFGSEAPATLQEVGDELGITRERVRQLQVRALDKIRKSAGEGLREFLN
jgi:RNA polymerase primary sigma factor